MDVSAPATAAVPGVAGHVITALLPTTEPQTETEVARACPAVSHVGVRKALHRLAANGVVLRVPGGYVINREHLVFPALELLDGLHGRLRERIREALQEWGGAVMCMGMFGSMARRDGDTESDIDLLLVSDDADAEDFSLDLAASVERWTGNYCQVTTLTRKELRRMKRVGEPIVDVWSDELDAVVGSLGEALGASRRSTK